MALWHMGTHGVVAKVEYYWELAPRRYLKTPQSHLKALRTNKDQAATWFQKHIKIH